MRCARWSGRWRTSRTAWRAKTSRAPARVPRPHDARARPRGGREGRRALQLSVAFCPMKPGRWLQAAATIANPYYGSEMLTCGVFEPLGEAG